MRIKGNAGEHLCTNPPYGYMKSPDNKKLWIVDEEAAAVVKRIFELCIAGKEPMQIAKVLAADKADSQSLLCKTRRKITVFLKIPNPRLSGNRYLIGYRNYGQTNATQQRQDGRACFRDCSIVLTAAKSSTSAQRTAFLQSRNTMFAPITRAIRELAPRISSERKR